MCLLLGIKLGRIMSCVFLQSLTICTTLCRQIYSCHQVLFSLLFSCYSGSGIMGIFFFSLEVLTALYFSSLFIFCKVQRMQSHAYSKLKKPPKTQTFKKMFSYCSSLTECKFVYICWTSFLCSIFTKIKTSIKKKNEFEVFIQFFK